MTISIGDAVHSDLSLVGYRIDGVDLHPLRILPRGGGGDARDVHPYAFLLPAGGFVEIPGVGLIEIADPGLYRLQTFDSLQTLQWIVYDNDVYRLAASVSSLFYHIANEPDDPKAPMAARRQGALNYAVETAPRRKVGATCLTSANMLASVCKTLALKSIVWEFENVSTELKPFASHAMTEIYVPSEERAVLFDPDRGLTLHREADGAALSCQDFVACAHAGDALYTHRLNAKPFAGFGFGTRIPTCEDFINDLYEMGGSQFDRDFYTVIGRSEIVFGQQAYDRGHNVSLPQCKQSAAALLARTNYALSDFETDRLRKLRHMRVSEFCR